MDHESSERHAHDRCPHAGVYGLRVSGLDDAARLLSAVGEDWPSLDVLIRTGVSASTDDRLDRESAYYPLPATGHVTVRRSTATTTFVFPPGTTVPRASELVHPYLSSSAATMQYWLGRHSFHAGAFIVDGGAWAVAGAKGAGKSTTLGWLAAHGIPILTDDLLVVADGVAFAGPSCVDLRPDAAKQLGVGENLGVVGARERWRYTFDAGPSTVPLRGWIFPAWGATVRVDAVPVAERIPRQLANLALQIPPPDPGGFMDLVSLPSWTFTRPRDWDEMPTSMLRLLDHLTGG